MWILVQFALSVCDGNPPEPPRPLDGEERVNYLDGEKWRMQQRYEFYLDAQFVEQYFRPRMGVGDMDLDRGVRQYIGNRYSESEGSYVIKSMKHAIDSGFQEMSDEDLQELVFEVIISNSMRVPSRRLFFAMLSLVRGILGMVGLVCAFKRWIDFVLSGCYVTGS